MKTCVGVFIVAFVVGLIANTSTAHALACTFTNTAAFADGQAQTINVSGCTAQTPDTETGPVGATVDGAVALTTGGALGSVSGFEVTTGNATLNLGGTVGFSTLVTLPPFIFVGGFGSSTIQIGATTYNVSQVDFTVSGHEAASVSGSGIVGAFVHYGLSVTPTDFEGTAIGVTGTVDDNCGSGFTICGGVHQDFQATGTIDGGAISSVIHISSQMSGELQLTTIVPNSNNGFIEARNSFDITSMLLLDANGVPIPGVQFVAEDGTIFPDAADMVTPLPAALPMFATGLGAMGLFGWRRKRKAQAAA